MSILKGILTLALAAVLGQTPPPKPVTPDPLPSWTAEEFRFVPVRVHLLRAPDTAAGTSLKPQDIDRIFRKVNGIWHTAGVHLWVESVVEEKPAFVEQLKNLDGLKESTGLNGLQGHGQDAPLPTQALLPLRPTNTLAEGRFHVYYIHAMAPNGIYMRRDALFVKDSAQLRPVPGGIDEPLPRVTAHELGHGMGLPHRQDIFNLMASGTTGTDLNAAEVETVRHTLAGFPWSQTAGEFLQAADKLLTDGKPETARARYRALLDLPNASPLKDKARERLRAKNAVNKPLLAPLRGVKRVLFLGDSITYAGGYVDILDTYLHVHFPDHPVELIDIGLPSETVSGLTEPNHAGGAFPRPDLHERLERALAKTKPDLVVACYGMNDGIYYPFETARFQKYQDGIRRLAARVRQSGAKLWLLTPPPFDPFPIQKSTLAAGKTEYPSGQPFQGYDDVLGQYSQWLASQKSAGWKTIDIHTPINAYVRARRQREPNFALSGDGVHLNEVGHKLIAGEILRAWGAPAATLPVIDATPEAKTLSETDARAQKSAETIAPLIHERQRLLTDAWLTDIGHKRPGMAVGVPLAQAQEKAAELENRIQDLLAQN